MDRVDDSPSPDRRPDLRPDDEPVGDVEEEGRPEAEADVSDGDVDPQSPEALLDAKTAEVQALADKLKRVEAGFVNETKRLRRQAEEDRKYAIEKVVVDLLPVLDALHGARGSLGDDDTSQPMREGLDLVERQLGAVLERHGVRPIEAEGRPFDPSRHQAMMMVDRPDLEPNTVCEVLRSGWALHGRVVRPAEVMVVRGAQEPSGGAGEATADAGQDDGGQGDAGRDDAGQDDAGRDGD